MRPGQILPLLPLGLRDRADPHRPLPITPTALRDQQPLHPQVPPLTRRLLICSLMIAIKYIDDLYYKNEYYAKLGGISKQ